MKTQKEPFPIQIGDSLACDFREKTWTFEMPKGFTWTGGLFVIVPIEEWNKINPQDESTCCGTLRNELTEEQRLSGRCPDCKENL